MTIFLSQLQPTVLGPEMMQFSMDHSSSRDHQSFRPIKCVVEHCCFMCCTWWIRELSHWIFPQWELSRSDIIICKYFQTPFQVDRLSYTFPLKAMISSTQVSFQSVPQDYARVRHTVVFNVTHYTLLCTSLQTSPAWTNTGFDEYFYLPATESCDRACSGLKGFTKSCFNPT